jgi:hypothetical protein
MATEAAMKRARELARKWAWTLRFPGQQRCAVCSFPLSETVDKGCVIGNCSYRPDEGSAEYERVTRNKADLVLVECLLLADLEQALDAWAQEARSQCAERIEKVAAQCAAGGHTSRAKMLNALAAEFRSAVLEQAHKEG